MGHVVNLRYQTIIQKVLVDGPCSTCVLVPGNKHITRRSAYLEGVRALSDPDVFGFTIKPLPLRSD